jgi:hypothetical protein
MHLTGCLVLLAAAAAMAMSQKECVAQYGNAECLPRLARCRVGADDVRDANALLADCGGSADIVHLFLEEARTVQPALDVPARVRELHVHGGSLEGCGWRLRTPTTLNITLAGVALAGDCMQPLLMAPEKVTALVISGGSVACAGGAQPWLVLRSAKLTMTHVKAVTGSRFLDGSDLLAVHISDNRFDVRPLPDDPADATLLQLGVRQDAEVITCRNEIVNGAKRAMNVGGAATLVPC